METKIWIVDKFVDKHDLYPQISQAAELLRAGEVVAFPTETVYGLGANAASSAAVKKIFQAKGRPIDNPLIVHIADYDQLGQIAVDIPDVAQTLIERLWPGPLTMVLKKRKNAVCEEVTAGLASVAVRMPAHPVALALIRESGLPLAAPSANRSGKPSPTSAMHVLADLNGKIAGIVDGGPTGIGVESTVLDCTTDIPTILRPGGVTKEELEHLIGRVHVDAALLNEKEKPKAPGMKYTHYAPRAPLTIVEGTSAFLQHLVDEQRALGKKVGVLTTEERQLTYRADAVISCGKRSDLYTVARHLYDALRAFDEAEVDMIYSECFPDHGIGTAIMNRLKKAAGYRILYEK
ncbi:tRNA threonylcarbamoyl adenosine modification protein, Sua5/YciO/YrdC/YwlC family [Anoxybacillus sp. B7M1]|jgi:L-threonylcarbamoyladenylate synthase|uniref:L-threonylcarbamoyladenylate synthase n=1 Tax=unclassified Anoxybacillus TaxID=2639704 RepID=UPI0005CDB521|nr:MULTISPECIES: L-threonylcarbamoyladenylate synthase [unclassified Anoxybacillus]ANB58003.1 tRNA threonylcarbamoyl adenosine modification protein, Sua5/YciO/YrdC/YwlC family [Anoxybacillus sp. B2M1]ANB65513.1 tRNA threonylcarbamoyl adenosine modification protein, Sua5/YciO/YrdC/YwlC family [Anoxybacillus sp. B7M1]